MKCVLVIYHFVLEQVGLECDGYKCSYWSHIKSDKHFFYGFHETKTSDIAILSISEWNLNLNFVESVWVQLCNAIGNAIVVPSLGSFCAFFSCVANWFTMQCDAMQLIYIIHNRNHSSIIVRGIILLETYYDESLGDEHSVCVVQFSHKIAQA